MQVYTFSSDFVEISLQTNEITDDKTKIIEDILNSKYLIISDNVLYTSNGKLTETFTLNEDTTNNIGIIQFDIFTVTIKNLEYIIKYDFDNTKLDILFEVYNKIFDVNYDVNNGIYNYDATNTSLVFLSNTYVIPVDLAKFVYDIVSYYMATYSLSVSDAMSKIITDEVSNIYSMKQDLEMKSAELMKVYISLSAYITPTA